MALYERMTFLLVAGTLGLFFFAFVLGAVGAVLTIFPELGRMFRVRLVSVFLFVRYLLEHAFGYLAEAYQAVRHNRLHART